MVLSMVTRAGFDQRQNMMEDRAWAASILCSAAAEIRRNTIFRALLLELIDKRVTRSDTDATLIILCPGTSRAVESYYAGVGPELRRMLPDTELRFLDAWLASEVQRWSARWMALDPAREGSSITTRAALDEVRRELEARPVPDRIAAIAARLRDGGSE